MERHIAHDLLLRFFKGKIQAALAARAGGVEKVRRERTLARAGRAGNQHTAAAVVALAIKHGVEPGDSRRDALGGSLMV